jgi:succinate dehydrogenase / fumarate reductase, cytochrome b subunit
MRWQALLGAVPLAGYLVIHLLGQVLALRESPLHAGLQGMLERWSLLRWLEIALIYVPLCGHAGLGLWRVSRARPSAPDEHWPMPWGRSLQRCSAGVLGLFLVFHIWQFQGRLWLGELSRVDFLPELCASLSSTALGGVPLVALGYLIGVGAAALHAAQGVYHFGLSWAGVAPARRQRLARACSLAGLGLFAAGALLIVRLATGSLSVQLLPLAASAALAPGAVGAAVPVR